MIGSKIAEIFLTVDEIHEYCNGNIYNISAPDGTKAPYIVLTLSDNIDSENDVLADFDITINIYDTNEDKRLQRKISKIIKDTLHYANLNTGDYSNIRIRFESRDFLREKEGTLSLCTMAFSGRASEEIK